MDLKDFVTETLMQIIEGIKDAQEKSSELGAIINPRSITGSSLSAIVKDRTHSVQEIGFEVALTSTTDENSKKGIGVALGNVGIGANKTQGEKEVSATSVRFSVPVIFPFIDNGNSPKSKISYTSNPGRRLQ